jgi:hypothetical protein
MVAVAADVLVLDHLRVLVALCEMIVHGARISMEAPKSELQSPEGYKPPKNSKAHIPL